MHMCIYIHNNETMMADCTIKDSIYVWHDRLHVFLFSSEKLEKDKNLKLFVLHLSTDFAYTLNHFCLFIQRQYTNALTFFHVYIYIYIYITYPFICITYECIYIYERIYVSIYMIYDNREKDFLHIVILKWIFYFGGFLSIYSTPPFKTYPTNMRSEKMVTRQLS